DQRKEEYIYDANGKRISSIYSSWDSNTSSWVQEYKDEYTYNGNGLITLEEGAQWDGSVWVNEYKVEYTYDGMNNIPQMLYSEWDNGSWVGEAKADITYDVNVKFSDILFVSDELEDIIVYSKPTNVIYSYMNNGNWEQEDNVNFYYSEFILSGVKNPVSNQVKTYPNPASDYVMMDLQTQATELRVFDMKGSEQIRQRVDSNQVKVNTSQLEAGVYFYTLSTEQGTLSGK